MARGGSRCRPGFFLPVRVLSRLFRRLFLEALQAAFDTGRLHFAGSLDALADPSGFAAHLQPTRHTDWVVYAKPPFAGSQQVLEYVGRYTHRIAIANQRLLDMNNGQVRFRYTNDRAAPSQTPQTMPLEAPEFIRRLLLHVLPSGFPRIRYDGWLGHRHRTETIARCRPLLGTTAAPPITGETRPPSDYRDRYESLTGVS